MKFASIYIRLLLPNGLTQQSHSRGITLKTKMAISDGLSSGFTQSLKIKGWTTKCSPQKIDI